MPSTRRALCVGINNFKNYPDAALQGCVNDAKDMAALYKDLLGFASSDITLLTDAQATKAGIMGALNKIVAEARNGGVNHIVFSLSSHGTQVPDVDGDEPDRADEAFCPHDLKQAGDQWDPNNIITDDELRALFLQLPESALLEVYLDTCHSGTGLRAIDFLLTRKPRFIPPPSLEAFQKVENCQSRGLARSLLERGVRHHILWTGCRADQTSADAKIDGTWHGAFTYYFVKHTRATKGKSARKTILQKVRADLTKNRYSQVPQLETDATNRSQRML